MSKINLRMKKFIFSVCFLFIGLSLFSQGVVFHEIPFSEALEKAKKEKKPIFMDCYTSWCGPCKQMMQKIFPQKEAGNYFNKKFVCVKYDVEKGEGVDLGNRYGITVVPTFVIIDSNGKMLHKVIGGGGISVTRFIEMVEETFDPHKALGPWVEKHTAGNRDKEFLSGYIKVLKQARDPQTREVAEELVSLSTLEENTSENYWFIFSDLYIHPAGSLVAKYLREHRKAFNASIGKKRVDARFSQEYMIELSPLFTEENPTITMERIDELMREIPAMNLLDETTLIANLKIGKSLKAGDINVILAVCEEIFKNEDPNNWVYYLNERLEGKMTSEQQKKWEELKNSK